ncbi:uncharacterized protein BXZ73DRAFT_102451 [Epithele typhae]|uniref:uncharacterized protein n=1 Tax=Epithele typhae TaxID=378194 RepID=UPI002007CBB4|nr:uncharacterized protein BXZ73DRAFT_102451 [Epithele typhae]KAH9927943.1 hypothetical protein BXZ73DRAFT_102451 [Epithele typhae]
MRSPRLPTEVSERVLEALRSEQDLVTLSACARVCSAWFPRSRFLLWRNITISDVDTVCSIRAAFERSPELCGWVHAIRLENPSDQGKGTPHAAPAILLPYLAKHLRKWEIVLKEGLTLFPPQIMACFRLYTAAKCLILECTDWDAYLPFHRWSNGFTALETFELRRQSFDLFKNSASPGDRALMPSRWGRRGGCIMKTKAPSRPIIYGDRSNSAVSDLTIGSVMLATAEFILQDYTGLVNLCIEVDEVCLHAFLNDPSVPEKIDELINGGLPQSLRSFDIILDSSLLDDTYGVNLNSAQRGNFSSFVQLVQGHAFLSKSGITCVVKNSTMNLGDRWRESFKPRPLSLVHW